MGTEYLLLGMMRLRRNAPFFATVDVTIITTSSTFTPPTLFELLIGLLLLVLLTAVAVSLDAVSVGSID